MLRTLTTGLLMVVKATRPTQNITYKQMSFIIVNNNDGISQRFSFTLWHGTLTGQVYLFFFVCFCVFFMFRAPSEKRTYLQNYQSKQFSMQSLRMLKRINLPLQPYFLANKNHFNLIYALVTQQLVHGVEITKIMAT